MDQDHDREMDGFLEEMVDDMSFKKKRQNNRVHQGSSHFKSKPIYLIAGGCCVLLIVAIIAIFFSGGNESSTEDMANLFAAIAGLEERIDVLEKESNAPENDSVGIDGKRKKISTDLRKLTSKVNSLEKKVNKISVSSKIGQRAGRTSVSKGKNRYHIVKQKDSLYGISKKYGITLNELCRLNGVGKNHVIHPGEKLMVSAGGN